MTVFRILIALCLPLLSASQSLRLAAVFGDSMVLQQGIQAPVWGKAKPFTPVTVTLAGVTGTAKADANGKWMVRLPALDYGGPYELTVTGDGVRTLRGVMVGEVWLASGQSNMEWRMGAGIGKDTEKEIAAAQYPQIRYLNIPRKTSIQPLEDMDPADWRSVHPASARELSAVAYFFARELHLDKKVAVGIISSSWGATSVQAWTSADLLATHPDFRERILQTNRDPVKWEATVAQQLENDRTRDSLARAADAGFKAGVQTVSYDDQTWKTVGFPIDMEKAGMPGIWGVSWYRKSFSLPDQRMQKKSTLRLYLRAREARIYLNGKELLRKDNPEALQAVEIPAGVLKSGNNVLTLRIYQHWGTALIGNATSTAEIVSADGKTTIPLTGDWRFNGELEPRLPQMQGYYNQPTVQFNGRIAPVIPYGIKGFLWYQGESNAGQAFQYRTLFPALIQDWRTRWGQGYLPFLYVQLANFRDKKAEPGEDAWAELREAQTKTLVYPNTGMATAIDIGDAQDIHPRNKLEVGRRLYLSARKVAYGEDIVHSGPMYEGMTVEGNRIRIRFSATGGGLTTSRGAILKGFSIAGTDGKFHWANAVIEGQTVVVSADQVAQPTAVRYAWESNPDGNLYNREGLPAVPFRTDRFKGMTE